MIAAFAVGRYPISFTDFGRLVWGQVTGTPSGVAPTIQTVIFEIRGPRVLAAVLVGAALAVAGTAFQGLFRNPLVSAPVSVSSSISPTPTISCLP